MANTEAGKPAYMKAEVKELMWALTEAEEAPTMAEMLRRVIAHYISTKRIDPKRLVANYRRRLKRANK